MSWSVTVNNLQEYERFPLDIQEQLASQHDQYPRDADAALILAKMTGLRSATLCGGRTPNPYGGDDIVDISIRGTSLYQDFLSEMREIIAAGPDETSDLNRHYLALARLRARPCSHVFDVYNGTNVKRCADCGVFMNGTMLYFEDENV